MDNKDLVRRYISEVINGKNIAAVDELWHPNLVWHAGASGEIHGADMLKQSFQFLFGGIPDLHAHEESVFAEGNLVATRWTITGTHAGTMMGIPATGKKMQWMGIDLFRIENGKIAEEWVGDDMLGLMQQLGAIPTPKGQP